jgi:hypothetical protein
MGELHKKNEINMEELTKNSLVTYVESNKVFLFLKLQNWDRSSIEESTQFLTKFDDVASDIIRYRDQGLPYVKLIIRPGKLPDIEANYVSWNVATSERGVDNRIPLSRVMARLAERYNPVNSEIRNLLPKLSQEELETFLGSYVKMFNEAKISRNENTSTMQLQVGDIIIYTGARRYGSGEQVTVTRVAEKSIQLSNGKRVARTYSNYKKRVTGIMKIFDDRVTAQPTTESRWIRKRII